MRISSPAIRPFASSQKRSARALSVETQFHARAARLATTRSKNSGASSRRSALRRRMFSLASATRPPPPMSGRVLAALARASPVRARHGRPGSLAAMRLELSASVVAQTDGKSKPTGSTGRLGRGRCWGQRDKARIRGGCPCGRYRLPPRKFAKMVNGLGSLEMAPCAALRNFSICMTFSIRKSRNSHVAAFCSLESESQYRSVAP